MDSIKDIWVGEERAETGFGAEIDRPAAIFDAREIGRIGITEDPSAEGDEAGMFFLLTRRLLHRIHATPALAVPGESALYAFSTSAMKTSKGLIVNPNGGLVVLSRSALENRI